MSLALLGLGAPCAGRERSYPPEELFQPFLAAELANWLQGPIARLASEEEIDGYLRLQSDDEARRFIEAFWSKRDPDPAREGNPTLELYEARAAEADKKFTEATVAGRRTDRGTIHILYGEPESVEYEELRDVSEPDVELWRYPRKADPGLDGRRPQREYRFAKVDDLTRFYSARNVRDPRRRRGDSAPGFPGDPGRPAPDEPRFPREP
ncbi:MAG TPA: GWxTD domain-containing protein [Thermoanaerobaculia bacterium]|nr:GWxTD domain-containing protein [Thermoanaerobaculia bacterium]